MGLCRCSKKKVTNQFCFEHRVNVCEDCMVEKHQTCVVQSYLKWLDASDYNPVCRICEDQLATGDCIRLVCYDVFHKECLSDWADRLPPNTAPAGYKCPVCSQPLFPAANLVSPVAAHLRHVLEAFPWARTGLGLPLIEDKGKSRSDSEWSQLNGSAASSVEDSSSREQPLTTPTPQTSPPQPLPSHETLVHSSSSRHLTHESSNNNSSNSSSVRVTAREDPPITPSHLRDTHHTRKSSSSDTRLTLTDNVDVDDEENKYKRRSAVEWFSRWWRTMHRPASRHHQGMTSGLRRMVVLLVLLGCVTVVVVLSYFSHGASDDDPLLDPFNNPNIHVEGE